MKNCFHSLVRRSRHPSRQAGYAYFMAFFIIMVVIVGSQAVLRNMANEGRRDREAEAIWRGDQYVRAIRIFYRKTGHYPQSLDDLQKGIPGMHFIRFVAMKDPMNATDGSWRLIYINASGQIIGSTRYASLQQMALMDLNGGKLPTPPSSDNDSSANSNAPDTGAGPNPTPDINTQSQNQQPGQAQTIAPATTNSPGTSLTATSGQAGNPLGNMNQPQNLAAIAQQKPTGPVDGPVFGGFITGVGSGHNFDHPSVKVYKGGASYQQWEFIWNPLEDQARAMQNGLAPQQGQASGQPGQSGFPGLPIANPNGGAPAPPEIQAPPPGQSQQPPDQQQ